MDGVASSQRPMEAVLNECTIGAGIIAQRVAQLHDRVTGSNRLTGPKGPEATARLPFVSQPNAISNDLRRIEDVITKLENVLFDNQSDVQVARDRY